MHGQAVVAGTRVPVATRVPVGVILDCVAAGMAVKEIVSPGAAARSG
jgi:uncharacterized protein (DUF433 family)